MHFIEFSFDNFKFGIRFHQVIHHGSKLRMEIFVGSLLLHDMFPYIGQLLSTEMLWIIASGAISIIISFSQQGIDGFDGSIENELIGHKLQCIGIENGGSSP